MCMRRFEILTLDEVIATMRCFCGAELEDKGSLLECTGCGLKVHVEAEE